MQSVSTVPARTVETSENETRHGFLETLSMKLSVTTAATKVSELMASSASRWGPSGVAAK